MAAGQNPISRLLSKLNELIRRVVEDPFATFPSKLEPAEIARRLERAMEDGVWLQSGGRHLAPNFYDIYLSIPDHQQLAPAQRTLVKDWQQSLIDFARQQNFFLRIDPVLRLHPDSSLRPGNMRIDARIEDPNSDMMGTQQLSPEELARLREQLAGGAPQAVPAPVPSNPNQPGLASPMANAPSPVPLSPASMPASPTPMPQAWLTIRLPQGGQQQYFLEKPVVNIGRQRYNDIVVEDKRVSRDHAKIMYQHGQFVIYDLGSTNGITVNRTPRVRQHTLRNGDHFTIGSYDFYFQRL